MRARKRLAVGDIFGQLTLDRKSERRTKNERTFWWCRCTCGVLKRVRQDHLVSGVATSCGCKARGLLSERNKARATHGMSKTRLYSIWHGMKQRCEYAGHKNFDSYGARGIAVCPAWSLSFNAFKNWALIHGYKDNLTLERIDNEKGYDPQNCKWATYKEQNANRRHSIRF